MFVGFKLNELSGDGVAQILKPIKSPRPYWFVFSKYYLTFEHQKKQKNEH